MVIPDDALIRLEKVRDYLLKPRVKDDKSKFLARAGYSRSKFQQLADDLRTQLLPGEGVLQDRSRFGDRYVLRGILRGPNGVTLRVRTIWENHTVIGWKFITLYPDKENQQ